MAKNVATGHDEPCLVPQPVIFRVVEDSSTTTSLNGHSVWMPVAVLNKKNLVPIKPKLECHKVVINKPIYVIACQTDGSYVLECRIASLLKSNMFLATTKLTDLLDYLMVYILGARINETRPLMETSMISVLSQIVNGTASHDLEVGEDESVGVEESDLKDFSSELVEWSKMILDQKNQPKRVHRGKVKCPICSKEMTEHCLKVHMRIHTGDKPFACPVCKKQFGTSVIFNRHKLTHETVRARDYKCHQCDFAGFTKESLHAHMFTHEEDQKLLCSTCGKQFGNKLRLQIHQKLHSGTRISVCDICGKSYCNSTYLKKHRKEVHEGERTNYTCEVCGEVFTQSSTFRKHKWRHEDYRPYKCDYCDKAFADSGVLRSHRLIHTGEKPYTCDVCGRSFRQKAALNKHSYTHGASRPHQCEKCSRQFIHKVYLTKHVCPFADEPSNDDDDKSVDDDLNETPRN